MYRTVYITLLHFLLIFGAIFPAFAQNYPVQVNVISSANALNYASFFADQNNHLRLAITLTDFNSDPIPVRLRLRFSGPATFYTNPTLIVGQAIVLEPGMTEIVQGIDLAPYLQPSALIKEPFNLNLNKLPSGYYTVCAEVIRDGYQQAAAVCFPLQTFNLRFCNSPRARVLWIQDSFSIRSIGRQR